MKRILCFVLSFVLMFNSVVVVSAAIVDVDPDFAEAVAEDFASNPEKYEPISLKLTEFLAGAITGSSITDKFYGVTKADAFNSLKNILMSEGATKTDGNYYYIDQSAVININDYVQNNVYALDGYYLITPLKNYTLEDFCPYCTAAERDIFDSYLSDTNLVYYQANTSRLAFFDTSKVYYYFDATLGMLSHYSEESGFNERVIYSEHTLKVSSDGIEVNYSGGTSWTTNFLQNSVTYINNFQNRSMGQPFKVFYTRRELQDYIDNGEQRSCYAPQLPNVTLKIPVTIVESSPNVTYNVVTENKTEVEIQNEYNTIINNYFDELGQFSDGTTPTPSPTPTPVPGSSGSDSGSSGDGSGDFSDGSVTPTPVPGADTETNSWLEKIYEWLLSFGSAHDSFAERIISYIESNDGKLDEIIAAIDALNAGETETESGGCKYDFTALSSFLDELWDNSDQKFERMIELLEENNAYQEELVESLDEIKALLVADTIMDIFKSRADETAQKAKEKFPTSIPWDVAMIVNAMSADPEKMKFAIPVKVESLGVSEKIEIDLTSEEWDKLAEVTRYFLSLLFLLYLIHLTRKLFFNGGDE